MTTDINLEEAREFTVKILRQSGVILKKYFQSGDFSIRQKAEGEIVTQADEDIDSLLRHQLRKKYPASNFLTEESAPADYSSLRHAVNLWVIDPLDGTKNFSRGYPHFAISIALVDYGRPKLALVHLPMSDKTFSAQEKNIGATCNGKPISWQHPRLWLRCG